MASITAAEVNAFVAMHLPTNVDCALLVSCPRQHMHSAAGYCGKPHKIRLGRSVLLSTCAHQVAATSEAVAALSTDLEEAQRERDAAQAESESMRSTGRILEEELSSARARIRQLEVRRLHQDQPAHPAINNSLARVKHTNTLSIKQRIHPSHRVDHLALEC